MSAKRNNGFVILINLSLAEVLHCNLINLLVPFGRYPCTGAPLLASKPHFLDADEKLVTDLDGLKPDRNEHDLYLHLEMVSALFGSHIFGIPDQQYFTL
jgi:hypothetical protein